MWILNWIEKINEFIQPVIWGWPVLCAILLAGANLSFRLNFFQITHCKLWLQSVGKQLFDKGKNDKDGITPFQALTTALAGSIGTGNIVGVATAITIGGPGAIFWMWISAIFGMMTIFAENVLGLKYRRKTSSGEWRGGAMYYIQYGLHSKTLASIFAFACVLASLGMGNMAQANSIAGAMADSFAIDPKITGGILAGILVVVSIGGIQRIAKVTEKLVPVMAVGYIAVSLVVLSCYSSTILPTLWRIVEEALGLKAALGGFGGTVMMHAMRCGLSRGIFTNEAGLGSSVMAHINSSCKEPVEQGMWGIFQVFIDTIVMCTITALVILCSGACNTGKDGAALSAAAFQSVLGQFGSIFISISILLFAFATMLSWSYYGETGMRYLSGKRWIPFFRLIFCLTAFFSCNIDLHLVWDICDTFNGLLAIPNLAAIFLLSGEVVQETQNYLLKHKGKS